MRFDDADWKLQLLGRQREEEDRRVMQAIAWLGERGVLEEPQPTVLTAGSSGREGGEAGSMTATIDAATDITTARDAGDMGA